MLADLLVHQAVALKHAIHAEHQHAAQAQAVALRWHDADQVADQVADQDADQVLAAALKSLLAILAELHLAIADVATSVQSMVCWLRFSSAKAKVAVMHL